MQYYASYRELSKNKVQNNYILVKVDNSFTAYK